MVVLTGDWWVITGEALKSCGGATEVYFCKQIGGAKRVKNVPGTNKIFTDNKVFIVQQLS